MTKSRVPMEEEREEKAERRPKESGRYFTSNSHERLLGTRRDLQGAGEGCLPQHFGEPKKE